MAKLTSFLFIEKKFYQVWWPSKTKCNPCTFKRF